MSLAARLGIQINRPPRSGAAAPAPRRPPAPTGAPAAAKPLPPPAPPTPPPSPPVEAAAATTETATRPPLDHPEPTGAWSTEASAGRLRSRPVRALSAGLAAGVALLVVVTRRRRR